MPKPVRDIFYQLCPWFSINQTEFFVEIVTDHSNNVYVLLFAIRTDVISFTEQPSFECGQDGRTVVIDIEPVPHVFSVAVYREHSSFCGIADDQGNQLFRKLIRAIVIGRIRDNRR